MGFLDPKPLTVTEAKSTYATLDANGKQPVRKGELFLNVKDYGAVGNGTTDDTAAIQSAINAATAGTTIYFPQTGSGAWYKTTATLNITTPSLRFLGNPRDIYAMSIKCTTANVTILQVKAPGFVAQHIGFIGDGGANGVGATVNGIELFGDTDGNLDANLWNASFLYLSVPVRTRGRNATISQDSLFSNSLKGVIIDGVDAVYHTGPNAAQNRGNTIRGCRFHNIGNAATDTAIEITVAAKVLHAIIADNFFDSNGLGRHIVAVGDATNPCRGLSIRGNKHTETRADVYTLTYVNNSTIRGVDIAGNAGTGGSLSNGIVLNNIDTLTIEGVTGLQLGVSGIYARNCTRVRISNAHFRAIGTDGTTTGHGFDIDSTNSQCNFDRLIVEGTDGWGFIGSPATSKFGSHEFRGCTLGGISSTSFIPEQVYLPAAAMGSITGTPNLVGVPGVGYPMAWQFDAATVEQVVGQINAIPNTWETFDAYVVWAPTSVDAGDVVWDFTYSYIVAGQLTSNGNTAVPGAANAATLAAGKVAMYKVASGQARSTAPMVVRIVRNAAAAADTYPADASLIGVKLVRAS